MTDPDSQSIPSVSNTVRDSKEKEDAPRDVPAPKNGQGQYPLPAVQGEGQVPMRRKITDNRFFLLLWKNYILQRRHLKHLAIEVFIIPLLFIFLLTDSTPERLLYFAPFTMPLFLVLCFIYPVANICKTIVHEKEQRLKESMKMMGLPEWLHWSAWLAKSLIFLGISSILITLAYKSFLFVGTDVTLLFLFIMSYVFSSITFAFLVASFCSKSTSSLTACSLLFFLPYIPYVVVVKSLPHLFKDLSILGKLGCTLVNSMAMGIGVDIMVRFEVAGAKAGVQWSTSFDVPSDNDDLSMLAVIGMLILDGFLYLFLAIYLETVFPGEYGVPLPFYFPLMPSYWRGDGTSRGNVVHPENAANDDTDFFEKEPENLNAGIQIKGLIKRFGRKVAVDGLTLNFYENQVTALLGHNGAGKTTTMSMLTGLYPPSRGTALVNGFDIRKEMKFVQNSLGLCPQHNVLFDEMTVEEHLKFFCKLKGFALPVEPEINRMLKALNLVDKREAQSQTLSGGMKRKLSVGIAFIGGSKVVLLDEPTAGMDPGARRSTWDLITGEKEGRTILLSTHFMDEADLLGDRIAILAYGKAVCCGSSFFLKKKYGGGYHLIMVKKPDCQVNKITELLQKYISEVMVDQNVGTELSYSLPEKKVSVFPDMFDELEKRKAELKVDSYGCSITTMEEVFMRVGEQVAAEVMAKQVGPPVQSTLTEDNPPKGPSSPELNADKSKTPSHALISDEPSPPKVPTDQITLDMNNETEVQIEESPPPHVNSRNTGFNLHKQQLWALLAKKGIYTWRNWFTYTVLAAVPLLPFIGIFINYHYDSRNTDSSRGRQLDESILSGVLIAVMMTFTMSFFAAGFILFPIKEREVNSKHLQFVSGVPFPTFWLGHLLFDMGYYLTICILLSIVPIALPGTYFASVESILAFFFVLVLNGWAVIPMTYLISFRYTVPSTGYTRTAFLYLLCGFFVSGLAFSENLLMIVIVFLLRFVPNVNVFHAIVKIVMLDVLAPIAKEAQNAKDDRDTDWEDDFENDRRRDRRDDKGLVVNYFAWGIMGFKRGRGADGSLSVLGIGQYLFNFFATGLLCLGYLFYIEFKASSANSQRSQNVVNSWDPSMMLEDSDVKEENERIRKGDLMELCASETMILKDLTKYYEGFLAVDHVCLGVQHGECFGLLGINGAGKTTVFKMCTGDIAISSGDAFVNGKSVRKQLKEVQRLIGYCPQFDALIPELTGRETIRLFARLRGIQEREINGLIDTLAADLLFTEHVAKPCGTYSGGNKRKLSTAISLLGNPSMVFLDEPTAGLDPVARRCLWNAVIKVRESGSSVVLTSHSMEECEALCTRVAIMVNGKFRCLGSTQHLKNKFGDGYTLIAQMKAIANEEQPQQTLTQRRTSLEAGRRRESLNNGARVEPWEAYILPLRNFIEGNFKDCQIKDVHPCYVHYHIPMGSISWAQMFRKMEEAKALFQLEAYSIGQTSLEQVFLGFSKGQYNAYD